VIGNADFSEYQSIPAERASKGQAEGGFDVLSNPFGLDEKLFLGALGMSGLTAYSSFYEIGKPKKGEMIFISAASGAVGQIVGQLAKREGLTVIGSVGNDAKLKYITTELGFDGGFNYKNEKPAAALKRVLEEKGYVFYNSSFCLRSRALGDVSGARLLDSFNVILGLMLT
jgi:NADPH-dependent curcumin reductase CurA